MEITNPNNSELEELGYKKPLTTNYTHLINKSEAEVSNPKSNKKENGKYKQYLLINMKDYGERLREVAKEEGKAHHTLAKEFIIAGIKRLEKHHKKEKFIENQYNI